MFPTSNNQPINFASGLNLQKANLPSTSLPAVNSPAPLSQGVKRFQNPDQPFNATPSVLPTYKTAGVKPGLLTPEARTKILDSIQRMRADGLSPERIQAVVDIAKVKYASSPVAQNPFPKPLEARLPQAPGQEFNYKAATRPIADAGAAIRAQAESGATDVYQGVNELIAGPQMRPQDVQAAYAGGGLGAGIAEAGAQVVKAGESGVASFGKIVGGGFQAALAPAAPVFQAMGQTGTAIGNTIGSNLPDSAAIAIEDTMKNNPSIASNATDIMHMSNLALPSAREGAIIDAGLTKTLSGIKGAGRLAGEFAGDLKATLPSMPKVNDLYSALTSRTPAQTDAFIAKQFQKGVRPSVSGQGTVGQVEKVAARQVQGVKAIIENKATLKLTDEFGDASGAVPKNLSEFAQAIDQTKQTLFEKYDAIQSTAGKKGATVDLKPVANELSVIARDKVLNDLHPEVVKYAELRAEALNARGIYTTGEAQAAIVNLNKSLDAFYKNPSYETASKAGIDSLVVNNLRKALDTAIESADGVGYQELKNQYGALRSIEKDVVHRAIVDGRKNSVGLMGSIGDMTSGAAVVHGILSMNPASFTTGAAIKAISWYQKYLNDPNTAIKKMFQAADRASQTNRTGLPSIETTPPPSPQSKIPQSTLPTKELLPVQSTPLESAYKSTIPQTIPKVKGEIPQTNANIPKESAAAVSKVIAAAEKDAPALHSNSKKISDGIGAYFVAGPTKTMERVMGKINRDYGGDVSKISEIKDIVRNTIVPKNASQLAAAVKSVGKLDLTRPIKVQTPENFLGYSGHLANVKLPGGGIGEVQIVSPEMFVAKMLPETSIKTLGKAEFDRIVKASGVKPGQGHVIYGKWQAAVEQNDAALKMRFKKESEDYYANFSKLLK